MNEKNVTLVQSSFKKVIPISEQAAEIFYNKLFEINPGVKPLFKGDMKVQGKKLMTMIGTVVNGLSRLETIVPAVQKLGKDHAGYGVKDEHYNDVGTSLLYTLGVGLGDDFTDEIKEAWTEAYSLLATTMKEAVNS